MVRGEMAPLSGGSVEPTKRGGDIRHDCARVRNDPGIFRFKVS